MIEKKTWPPFFEMVKDGRKRVELRLADFKLHEGDLIEFREFDNESNTYTGRSVVKRVKTLFKIQVTDFNYLQDVLEFGHYLFELEDVKQ